MSRAEFAKKTKLEAWDRADGKCEGEGCGLPLKGKRIEYDHRIPCALGGGNTLENCVVLCKPCHDGKTFGRDIPVIAKVARIRKREAGIKKKSSFRGWRKMNGNAVWNE